MQNAATTTNLRRHLFIWLILWPNVLFHNSGSLPILCSLTIFPHYVSMLNKYSAGLGPLKTTCYYLCRQSHGFWDSDLIWSSFWTVVGKINAHSDLCLFLQVTFTLADLICAEGTRGLLLLSNQRSSCFHASLPHFPSFWD